jgi:hypothetical protein
VLSISVSDILKVERFKHLNEAQLIHPKNDYDVLQEAFTVGMDITQGYKYEASQHLNIKNQPVIGYRLIGEIRNDKEFRNSSLCTAELRTLSNLRQDVTLVQELQKLQGGNFSYGKDADEDVENDRDYQDSFEDGYKAVEKQIDMLNDLATHIRGCSIGENGGLKTYGEWQESLNSKE